MAERVETRVRDIQIQPMKGGGNLVLSEAVLTKAGLETIDGKIQDHFLFAVSGEVGEKGYYNFFTQRVQVDPKKNLFVPGSPELALAKPENREGKLSFQFNQDRVNVPDTDEDDPTRTIPVQLWDHTGLAIEVPALSEWLSDNLKRKVKVARTSGPWNRLARQNFVQNDNPLRAQDGYPVHAVIWEDVVEIFKAIGAPPDANRFRYQILLEGLVFRNIHTFARGEVNGVEIVQAKPCGRCEVTGIDQETGKFSQIKPLAGLARLGVGRWVRGKEKAQIVGENWLPQGRTEIKNGDVFIFTEQRAEPLELETPASRS